VTIRTFCTIIKDEQAEAVLSPFADIFGRAERWMFREIYVRKNHYGHYVKPEAQLRFSITSRHANSIKTCLEQAVEAWKGGLKHRVQTLADRIEKLEEKVARHERLLADPAPKKPLSKRKRDALRFRLHQAKRHLQKCKDWKARDENELKAGRPRICFGGRGLLREAQAAGDIWRWQAKRSSRIFVRGSGDETAGNQSCQWDGQSLSVKLPGSARGETVSLGGVSFRYGQEALEAAQRRNSAIAWLLFRDDFGRWHAHATIDEPEAPLVTDVRVGVVAVDLNEAHLAVTLVDRMGNPVCRETLPFPPAGTDEHVAEAVIGDAVATLVAWAKANHYGIAIEKLDFGRKKSALKAYGKRHARRLSGFAYAAFRQILAARCAREGIDLVQVDPAYTSVVGGKKYARWRGLTRHHAAALVIGRRALGFGERFVCMDGVTLGGPGRNRPRHVLARWRSVSARRARKAGKACSPTARSARGRDGGGRPVEGRAPAVSRGNAQARTDAIPAPGGFAVGPPCRSPA
jgi:IS605 OrfB family transposase